MISAITSTHLSPHQEKIRDALVSAVKRLALGVLFFSCGGNQVLSMALGVSSLYLSIESVHKAYKLYDKQGKKLTKQERRDSVASSVARKAIVGLLFLAFAQGSVLTTAVGLGSLLSAALGAHKIYRLHFGNPDAAGRREDKYRKGFVSALKLFTLAALFFSFGSDKVLNQALALGFTYSGLESAYKALQLYQTKTKKERKISSKQKLQNLFSLIFKKSVLGLAFIILSQGNPLPLALGIGSCVTAALSASKAYNLYRREQRKSLRQQRRHLESGADMPCKVIALRRQDSSKFKEPKVGSWEWLDSHYPVNFSLAH